MSSGNSEQERLKKLRDRQLQARDPQKQERKSQQTASRKYRKVKQKESFIRDSAKTVSQTWRGLIIGGVLGFLVFILLPIFVEADWANSISILAIPVLMILGLLFGASFEWRDQMKRDLK